MIAASVALALLLAMLLLRAEDGRRAAAPREPGVAARTTVGAADIVEPDAARSAESTRVASETARGVTASDGKAVELTRPARFVGRVLDLFGDPVEQVEVAPRTDPKRPFARTATDGSFSLERGDLELTVVDPRWYTLRDTEPLPREGGREVLVLVAPAIEVSGVVVDTTGQPLSGAALELVIPWSTFAAFPLPLDRGRAARGTETATNAHGSFALTIPIAPRLTLSCSAKGFAEKVIAAPTAARSGVVITLDPLRAQSHVRIEGEVVHASGAPAVGATVRMRAAETTAGSNGGFVLDVRRDNDEESPLVAVLNGFQAAVVPEFGGVIRRFAGAPPPQRLVLGPAPLSITGRVVDHEDRPLRGFLVQPVDPILLMTGAIPPISAESVGNGAPLQSLSGADGSFELRGLQDRAYRLQAHSGEALVRIESEPIPAGARDVRLVVPADARFPEVQGVVVGHDGAPLAGVQVRSTLIVLRSGGSYTMENSKHVDTDAKGRFVLVDVPRDRSRISVDGDAILPASHDLAGHEDGRPVRILAARRCHVRVEGVPDSAGIAWVEVRDATDQALLLMQFQSGGSISSYQAQITDGGSPLFAVSETARTVVFRGDGDLEVARSLTLRHGEITVVRW